MEKRFVECPKNIGCSPDGEVFTHDWVHKMGEAHLLEDSIVNAKMATVYIGNDGGRRVGMCADNLGTQTMVYRLPDGIGQLAPAPSITDRLIKTDQYPALPGVIRPPRLGGPTRYFDPMLADFTLLPKHLQTEQIDVLNWSYRANSPLYLGPCDSVTGVIQGMFNNTVRSVTIQTQSTRKTVTIVDEQRVQADNSDEKVADVRTPTPAAPRPGATIVAGLPPTPTPTAPATATPAPVVNAPALLPQPGNYVVAGISNDNNCPGNYILGRVLNADGAPVAGVRISFVDQWGNRGESVSKAGAADYGNFDFPISDGRARDIYVTVVDGAGNPLSATAVVQHGRESGGDAPCHHVVWQGN